MGRPRGRSLGLSRGRRLVIDYLHFCHAPSTVAVERRVNLAELAAARAQAVPKPGWLSVLLKGYGLAARAAPEFRRSLLTFPFTRIHEHDEPTALVTVERELDGEPAVFTYPLKHPDRKSIPDINAELNWLRAAPLGEVKPFRKAVWLLGYPRPVRRALMWLALKVRGSWRERYAGTFAVSSVVPAGGDLTFAQAPHTLFFAPARIEPNGDTTLRVFFDHRVTDGAPAARALAAVEHALCGPVLSELRALAPGLKAAG
ncbi:MAG: hypothetical protein K2V38_06290 [Gemmataceae bacterium]|nr:hypothetical protein [Gemmataceae bacterium]